MGGSVDGSDVRVSIGSEDGGATAVGEGDRWLMAHHRTGKGWY